MAKIKRFFECLVPVSVCNLECPYCYIIQEDRRKMTLADMPYSPEHIARALRPERVGERASSASAARERRWRRKRLSPSWGSC